MEGLNGSRRESSGTNSVTAYLDNPYFDGVVSAITTQAEVTFNVRQDRRGVMQRRANMGGSTGHTSYPGGDNLDNLHVMPHELIFGFAHKQGRNAIPGHPSMVGFSSLNGINYGNTDTDEELESRIIFLCLAKTPYVFDNVNQLKHGFTGIGSGSGTTFHTGEHEIFPGDKLHWNVVPRPIRPGGPMAGGQYGNGGPGSRQGNPRVGTPRGKLRFRINPSRFNDMRPSINHAVSCMLKPASQGGCSDRSYEQLFMPSAVNANHKKPTPQVEHAMSLLYTMTVTAVRALPVFVEAGIVQWSPGMGEIAAINRIGLFKTKKAERAILEKLVNTWFLGLSANKAQSIPALRALQNTIPSGFNSRGTAPRRTTSDASRYVQIATNIANIQAVGNARAIHSTGRREFATSLSYAKRGQQVDVLIRSSVQAY